MIRLKPSRSRKTTRIMLKRGRFFILVCRFFRCCEADILPRQLIAPRRSVLPIARDRQRRYLYSLQSESRIDSRRSIRSRLLVLRKQGLQRECVDGLDWSFWLA